MASEPSDTEIRAMYATALERIAALTSECEWHKRAVDVALILQAEAEAETAALKSALATAKREAVEAFVKAVEHRFYNEAANDSEIITWHDALDAELARIREAK